MKFLKSFFFTLREFFRKRDTSLGSEIRNNETLSRYVFSRSHFSPQTARVKYNAFMPRQGEVSVFRIDQLSEKQIWTTGAEIASGGNRKLHARGDIRALVVRESRLDVVSDEPPTRHANVIGWPQEKSEQQLIAQQLAASAVLRLKD